MNCCILGLNLCSKFLRDRYGRGRLCMTGNTLRAGNYADCKYVCHTAGDLPPKPNLFFFMVGQALLSSGAFNKNKFALFPPTTKSVLKKSENRGLDNWAL